MKKQSVNNDMKKQSVNNVHKINGENVNISKNKSIIVNKQNIPVDKLFKQVKKLKKNHNDEYIPLNMTYSHKQNGLRCTPMIALGT